MRRGFTILELLVVIAIIGLLTSVILVSLMATRANARDARRMSDIQDLQKALALYQVDHGRFPIAAESVDITGADSVSTALLEADALTGVPLDPVPSNTYVYATDTNGRTYAITFCLETSTIDNYEAGCDNTVSP